jgi:hypothetical protein
MRTTASALFLLINNLLGIAVGTYYFGLVSDLLKPAFGAGVPALVDLYRHGLLPGRGPAVLPGLAPPGQGLGRLGRGAGSGRQRWGARRWGD